MAICTEYPCGLRFDNWKDMRIHYKTQHPEVKRPDKYFERDWRESKGRWAK